MGIIGERVLRTEDPDLLTGKGTYVDNLDLPGAAHVVYVRSTVAHARIVSIDADEARTMPGVLGVHAFADVDADGYGLVPNDHPMLPTQIRRPVLASDVVRYVGEPVVAVVAETRAQAVDASERVIVDYDPLPVVVDMEEAKADGIVLFPEFGTNTVVKIPSGREADFSACDVVIEARIVNQRLAPSPLEPRVAASRWEAPDANGVRRLTHWQACQGAHSVRAPICEMYGLPPEQVRVIVPDVGGGFGAKAFNYPEDILLPWLAKKHDRPVRYTETRTESMNGLGHGRAQVQYVKLGGTRDGRLLAYSLDVVQDSGAWPRFGAFLPVLTRRMATGTYDIPSVSFTASSVLTNTVPTIAYRGAGRPEAAAAIERAVDLFAAEIGMDAVDVRRINVIAPERFPFKNTLGTTYDSGQYARAIDLVLDAADYPALRAEQAHRRAAGDTVMLGIGVCSYVEITAASAGGEYGSVTVHEGDGGAVRATVVTGTTPYGQGHRTAWAMLAADRLGLRVEDITVLHGDTDIVPHSEVSGASRSLQLGGTNVWRAAGTVVDRARDIAARLLEADVADVVVADGVFHVAGTPAVSVTWSHVLDAAEPDQLSAIGDFAQADGTFPSGAHLAVVEVDTETGKVVLRSLVAVDDAGRILNPLLAEGQVHGGLVQGAAQALFEEVVYDPDGNPLTGNFADYGFPSAAEFPSFVTVHLESPTPLNDLGAKGIGESGTIGATPAVQSAVIDALSHLGIRHIDLPCSPRRVWEAISRAVG